MSIYYFFIQLTITYIIAYETLSVIASGKSGTPRDTFVPVGKRNKQAKKQTIDVYGDCLVKSAVYDAHRPLFPSVRSTLCHCEAPLCGAVAISRKGHRIKHPRDTFVPVGKIGDPAGYFCTRGERRVHKIRICRSIALFNDRER